MPIFLLIRHGENDFVKQGRLPGHLSGIHLNERGREQAAALAESLQGQPIRAIYASPLERAVETAGPLARALDQTVQLCPALLDTNVGDWQGLQLKDLHKLPLWKQVQKHPAEVRFPGGESFLELQERLVEEIEALRLMHKQKDMLAVVFHCDPIKLVLAHYIGLPLDNFQKLGVATGSVSILMLGKTGGQLAALNLRPPFTF
ncbi:MAG TPA: histidine phosphatase family protein [Anaerolineales bacterium]|nr:histidine phosphatase family protein [Anaerolineales bacterium]